MCDRLNVKTDYLRFVWCESVVCWRCFLQPNVSQPPFRVFPLPAHPVLHRPMRAWTGNPAFWLPVAARCSRTSRQPGRLSDGHQLASSSSSGSGRSEVSRCLRGGHASRQVKSQRSPAASAVKSNQIKPRLLDDDGGKVERLAVTVSVYYRHYLLQLAYCR